MRKRHDFRLARIALASIVTTLTLTVASPASAQASFRSWNFNLFTSGDEIHYTSPNAVIPSADRFGTTVDISQVEATISFNDQQFTVDATSLVDLDALIGTAVIPGPAPLTLFDETIEEPEGDGSTLTATISMTVDDQGVGHLDVVDIFLGTAEVDIFGLGTQTVQIESVRVVGSVLIWGRFFGDANDDFVVNVQDLLAVINQWGSFCPLLGQCPADVNIDFLVNVLDLLEVITHWGEIFGNRDAGEVRESRRGAARSVG